MFHRPGPRRFTSAFRGARGPKFLESRARSCMRSLDTDLTHGDRLTAHSGLMLPILRERGDSLRAHVPEDAIERAENLR